MLYRVCLPGLLLPASLLFLGCGDSGPPAAPPPKLPVVLVSTAVSKQVTDYEDFTGRTEGRKSVDIRARVTGYLKEIRFEDGQEVKEGQVLFEIDPLTLRATLNQAEANLRQSETHLNRLQADSRRAEGLLARRAISREEYDKIIGDRDEAKEAVGVAKANRELCKINLDYTHVRSPINGRISRRLIDEGNLVKADDTMLTTIVFLDIMYVYFDIDERTLLYLRRLKEKGKIPSTSDNRSPVQLGLADKKGYELTATIDFEDNRLDVGTGTYRLRAVVPNAKHFLSPGLYVRVRLPVGQPHQALLVAEQALGRDQEKKFLYVVDKEDIVKNRPVEVGRLHDGLREITAGLKRGERVVVNGLQRVRLKTKVSPKLVPMPRAESKSRPPGTHKNQSVQGKQTAKRQ